MNFKDYFNQTLNEGKDYYEEILPKDDVKKIKNSLSSSEIKKLNDLLQKQDEFVQDNMDEFEEWLDEWEEVDDLITLKSSTKDLLKYSNDGRFKKVVSGVLSLIDKVKD